MSDQFSTTKLGCWQWLSIRNCWAVWRICVPPAKVRKGMCSVEKLGVTKYDIKIYVHIYILYYSILFYIILYYSILFYIILYYRFRSYPHGSLLGLRRPWDPRGHCGESLHGLSEWGRGRWTMGFSQLGMGQYLLIQFLMGWTSIYQLFWCSPGVQGFDTLPIGNWWLCPHHSCHSSDSKHCPDWNRWWHETCTQKRQDFLCNEAKLSQLPGLWGPVLWNSWRVSKPWTGPTSKQRPSLAVLWTTRSLRDRGCLHEMETVGR